MTKKKMAVGAQLEGLSSAIPARLYNSDAAKLREYEKRGLNISDIIRRCVNKALPDVVKEIRESLMDDPHPVSSTHDADLRRLVKLGEREVDRRDRSKHV